MLKRRQGFSLIELLIAATIVAAEGALLAGGLLAANRSMDRRTEQALLTHLLASQSALLDSDLSDQTPRQGTFAAPLDEMAWSLEWVPMPNTSLVRATLTVEREGRSVNAVTYRRLAQ